MYLPQCNPLNVGWDSGRMRHRATDIDRKPSSYPYIKCTRRESSCVLPMMRAQTFVYRHFHAFLHLQSVECKKGEKKLY